MVPSRLTTLQRIALHSGVSGQHKLDLVSYFLKKEVTKLSIYIYSYEILKEVIKTLFFKSFQGLERWLSS